MKKHHKFLSGQEFINNKNLLVRENKKKQIEKKLLLSPLNINKFNTTNSFLTIYSQNKQMTFSNQKTTMTSQNTYFTNPNYKDNYEIFPYTKKKIDYFMKKKIKTSFSDKNLKKNENSIEIFTFLPSTNHTNYKNNSNINKIKIPNLKNRFKESKLEPLSSLEKKIKKKIRFAVLNHKLKKESKDNIEIKNRNIINIKNIKIENTKNISENEIKENKFPQIIQKQTKLTSISPRISFPFILKDSEILNEIFTKNFNYQKNILKERFKINNIFKKSNKKLKFNFQKNDIK